mmetsp:Transcript_10650/g.19447  ORF Transcript_10650/g.19447 Transcript_10650/m.19447 type:complete len:260 (-) Transcript_10650:584-1363(-)
MPEPHEYATFRSQRYQAIRLSPSSVPRRIGQGVDPRKRYDRFQMSGLRQRVTAASLRVALHAQVPHHDSPSGGATSDDSWMHGVEGAGHETAVGVDAHIGSTPVLAHAIQVPSRKDTRNRPWIRKVEAAVRRRYRLARTAPGDVGDDQVVLVWRRDVDGRGAVGAGAVVASAIKVAMSVTKTIGVGIRVSGIEATHVNDTAGGFEGPSIAGVTRTATAAIFDGGGSGAATAAIGFGEGRGGGTTGRGDDGSVIHVRVCR